MLVNPLRSRRFAEAVGVLARNDRVDAAMPARLGLVDGLQGTPPASLNLLLLRDLLALCRKLVEQLAALRKLRDEIDPELVGGAGSAVEGMRSAPRAQLFMAAVTAIRCDPGRQACYQRLLARGKPHKVAIVAVMRRLVTLRPSCSTRIGSGRSRPPPALRRRPSDRRAARRRNSAPAAFSYAPELDTGHGSCGKRCASRPNFGARGASGCHVRSRCTTQSSNRSRDR